MAGSLGEAIAQIMSVQPGELAALATKIRDAGAKSAAGGRTLSSSAQEVGAQQGDPYTAYRDRLAPVAEWMTRFEPPATSGAAALQNASTVAEQAQEQAKTLLDSLARYEVGQTGPTAAAANQRAEAQALEQLNQLIEQMTTSFTAVQPADSGAAPVRGSAGGAGAVGAGAGASTQPASATSGAAAGASASDAAGVDGAAAAGAQAGLDPAAAAAVGPTSGPFNGWVQDPNSGNLVDPTTGREVGAGGQFLDPVTGQPFGDAAQSMSRLEGLQGGVGTTGGLFGVGGGVGAFTGTTGGGGGAGGGFAGLYGGVLPPSLMGSNPAMGQLQAKANQNLQSKAAVAQRYSTLMTGQQEQARPYMPPMGGAGGGMGGGGGRAGRPSRRLVSEPSNVWGATGRGDRAGRQRSSGTTTELVEDADVWTGGQQPGSGVLDR